MDELLDKLKSIQWLQIIKSLPFEGGASSTKWVYLACAAVVNACLIAMVSALCWVYIHEGKADVMLVGLIATTIGVVVGIPANAANQRRKLNIQSSAQGVNLSSDTSTPETNDVSATPER